MALIYFTATDAAKFSVGFYVIYADCKFSASAPSIVNNLCFTTTISF